MTLVRVVLLVALLNVGGVLANDLESIPITLSKPAQLSLRHEHRTFDNMVPFKFVSMAGQAIPRSINIQLSFCSQCGRTSFYVAYGSLPDRASSALSWQAESTGTAVKPAEPFVSNATFLERVVYGSLEFEEPFCDLVIIATPSTTKYYEPSPNITARRDDPNLIVQVPASSGPHMLFWAPLDNPESGWCDLRPITDWSNVTTHIINFEAAQIEPSASFIVAMKVRRDDLTESSYVRALVAAPAVRNVVRILSNLLIPLMVLLPLVILFGGYHRKFGIQMLMFQYVNVFEQQHTQSDSLARKASLHAFILIGIQGLCQILVITLSLVVEKYLSLHLPIAVFSVPILILGAVALLRRDKNYLLGFIFLQIWFVAMQVTMMLIFVNIGSDSIYVTHDHAAQAPVIVTAILVVIDVIAVVVSLSPLTFLYMKLSGADFTKSYESALPSESHSSKIIIGISFAYVGMTLTWIGVSLYFLPQLELKLEIVLHFFIELHLTLAAAFFSLFAVFGCLQASPVYASLSIALQLLALPVLLTFAIVDLASSERYDDLAHELIARGVVGLFRAVAFGCSLVATILLMRFFPTLTEERISWWHYVRTKISPRSSFIPHVGRTNFAVFVVSSVLVLVSVALIVFRIEGSSGEYPQVYLMFYLLLIGQPSALFGSFTDTPMLLIITLALDLIPAIMWMQFVSYGAAYWIVLLLELVRLALIVVAVAGSGIKHWRRSQEAPAGLASDEFGAEMEDHTFTVGLSTESSKHDTHSDEEARVSDGDIDLLDSIDKDNDSI